MGRIPGLLWKVTLAGLSLRGSHDREGIVDQGFLGAYLCLVFHR